MMKQNKTVGIQAVQEVDACRMWIFNVSPAEPRNRKADVPGKWRKISPGFSDVLFPVSPWRSGMSEKRTGRKRYGMPVLNGTDSIFIKHRVIRLMSKRKRKLI